jgi:hypothetical protein
MILGSFLAEKDCHVNEYIINKLKIKKSKNKMPNCSYMFLNHRHKINLDHSSNIQNI